MQTIYFGFLLNDVNTDLFYIEIYIYIMTNDSIIIVSVFFF